MILAFFILPACEKHDHANQYTITKEKLKSSENCAFVGEWERTDLQTQSNKTPIKVDVSPEELKITKRYWMTEGQKRNYSLEVVAQAGKVSTPAATTEA